LLPSVKTTHVTVRYPILSNLQSINEVKKLHVGLWLWKVVLLEGNSTDWLKSGEVSGRCGKLISGELVNCYSLNSAELLSEGRRNV
jgi:hypothetical protein